MNKNMVVNTLISAIGGAVIGGGVTYLVVKKHYKQLADTEIEDVKRHYALIRKDRNTIDILGNSTKDVEQGVDGEAPDATPEQYAKAKNLISRLGYEQPKEETVASAPVTNSIFDRAVPADMVGPQLTGPNGVPINPDEHDSDPNDPMMGYERISGQPYIISLDEFFNTEEEWEKSTLSFYEGDDTLIDERESIVDDRERYIGERHLSMFGVLSDDKKIVYVRNPQISTDFEIVLEKGKYTVRVLGEDDPDIEPKQPLRRMRASD